MEIKEILQKHGFRFNHSLGQNFLTDGNLLSAIAADGGVTKQSVVMEIGAGAGSLTRVLAEKAERVIAYEVDEALKPVLADVLDGYDNVETRFENVLKLSDDELLAAVGGAEFDVVANLPYYITTPLIMRFVESTLPVQSLTVMVQKEVAERLCARKNTPEYGAISVAVALRGRAEIKRIVDKKMFFPVPKVDSAVVKLTLDDRYGRSGDAMLLRLIRCAFAMRRKTLVNNVLGAFSLKRAEIEGILTSLGYDVRIRGEVLGVEEFIAVSDEIRKVAERS